MNKCDKVDIIDKETGEIIDIEILENILEEKKRYKYIAYENKFRNKTINKEELKELMKYKKIKEDQKIRYDEFFLVNLSKKKPDQISKSDYAGFFMLLNYITYKNSVAYRNGRHVSKKVLVEELEFNNISSLNRLIRNLRKCRMIGVAKLGGVEFLLINPVYAQRNVKINSTIYSIFKEDLDQYLNEYQIRLLELENEDLEVNTVIPIIEWL